jgi:glycosyltransferase involved in cell wall biosynthesis
VKILLSAYACEPGKGSEPMVGWRWVHEIKNLGHEVWVLTRSNNRPTIEAFEAENGSSGIHYVYLDLPYPMTRLKNLSGGIYAFYYLWQIKAFFVAHKLHSQVAFDRAHQLTFVSIRFPSFLGLLGVPFWVGPLGGGERSPCQLRRPLGRAFYVRETFRDLLLLFHGLDPLRAISLSFAERILTTTSESTAAMPFWLRRRCQVVPAIASDGPNSIARHANTEEVIELLYAGMHKDWKGLRLGLRALARVRRVAKKPYHLTIVGRGPDHNVWRSEVHALGLQDIVTFIGWMPREELLQFYAQKQAFLYPSLHDSGGIVVWEAMASGLPVICLNCGGPGLIVDHNSGFAQEVIGRSYEEVVDGLAEGMLGLQDPSQVQRWSEGAKKRCENLTWSKLVRSVYAPDS